MSKLLPTIAAIAGAAIAGLTFPQVAAIGGIAALSQYLSRPKKPRQQRSYSTVTAASTEAQWVIGRARTGGVLLAVRESSDNRRLDLVFALAEGPIQGVDAIWIDGVEFGNSAYADGALVGENLFGTTTISETTPFSRRISILPSSQTRTFAVTYEGQPYDPAVNTRASRIRPYWRASVYPDADSKAKASLTGAGWTVSDIFDGISIIHVALTSPSRSQEVARVWPRIPELQFLVHGAAVQPSGYTAPVSTTNAAAAWYWWLTVRRGIPDSAIDQPSLRAAIALCSLSTTYTGTIPGDNLFRTTTQKYEVGGVVTAGDNIDDVEEDLNLAWNGAVIDRGGFLYFRPGTTRSVSHTVTEEDHLEILSARPGLPLEQRANTLLMTLDQCEGPPAFTSYDVMLDDDDAVTRDGELKRDLGAVRFITSPVIASRLMYLQLQRYRSTVSYIFTIPGIDEDGDIVNIIPTDIISVYIPELGTSKQIYVTRVSFASDWRLRIEGEAGPGTPNDWYTGETSSAFPETAPLIEYPDLSTSRGDLFYFRHAFTDADNQPTQPSGTDIVAPWSATRAYIQTSWAVNGVDSAPITSTDLEALYNVSVRIDYIHGVFDYPQPIVPLSWFSDNFTVSGVPGVTISRFCGGDILYGGDSWLETCLHRTGNEAFDDGSILNLHVNSNALANTGISVTIPIAPVTYVVPPLPPAVVAFSTSPGSRGLALAHIVDVDTPLVWQYFNTPNEVGYLPVYTTYAQYRQVPSPDLVDRTYGFIPPGNEEEFPFIKPAFWRLITTLSAGTCLPIGTSNYYYLTGSKAFDHISVSSITNTVPIAPLQAIPSQASSVCDRAVTNGPDLTGDIFVPGAIYNMVYWDLS